MLDFNNPEGQKDAAKNIWLNIISREIPFALYYDILDKSGAIDNMYYEGQYPGKPSIPKTYKIQGVTWDKNGNPTNYNQPNNY